MSFETGGSAPPRQPAPKPSVEPEPRASLDRAAGWYDDPASPGTTRWWNGTAWTDHRGKKAATASSDVPVAGVWGHLCGLPRVWQAAFGGGVLVWLIAVFVIFGSAGSKWEESCRVEITTTVYSMDDSRSKNMLSACLEVTESWQNDGVQDSEIEAAIRTAF